MRYPICLLNLSDAWGKARQNKERVKREIESTDRAIDKLVYELYGLSPEEIAIVEGKG